MKAPREEFLELMTENIRANGFDELSSKIVAVLFLEPDEISLEDLAHKTGYSLSGVSTSLKFMEAAGLVHKHKKPNSKKVYMHMEKSIIDLLLNMMKKKHDDIIVKSRDALPSIIEHYKRSKSSRQELRIVENYYKDVLLGDKLIHEFIDKIERLRRA